MDSFEINKIIAAVLVTVLLVFGISKTADFLFNVKKPNVKGYKVEISTTTSTQASTEVQVDITALLALGNIDHGAKVFKKCAACHSIKQDGGNKIGPKLWNVMFRPAGAISDYKYSQALKSYGKEWTWEEMNGFLTKPSKWIKGNKMGFAEIILKEGYFILLLQERKNF